MGHYKMRVGSPTWRRDVERVTRVRDALGPATEVLVDASQGWSRTEALAAVRALDELDPFWIEEPAAVGDTAGTSRIVGAVLMPDLPRCGGPTGFLLAAAQVQRAGPPISDHLFARPNTLILEYLPAQRRRRRPSAPATRRERGPGRVRGSTVGSSASWPVPHRHGPLEA